MGSCREKGETRGLLQVRLFCGSGLALDPSARHEMHSFITFVHELNEAHEDPHDGKVSGNCEDDCHGTSCLG